MPGPRRSALYRLTAFGITNPMVTWGIAHGTLEDTCDRCQGSGYRISSPCPWRDLPPGDPRPPCRPLRGCATCRVKCPACRGRKRLASSDAVHAEDFGDAESLAIARALMPGLDPDPRPRIDMHARAL